MAWRNSEPLPEVRQYGGVLKGFRYLGMDHLRRQQHGLVVVQRMGLVFGLEILQVLGSLKCMGTEVKVRSR